MLFMEGGPGHMDTFDPKPELQRLHKAESTLAKEGDPFKFFVGSPFSSRKVGQSGIEMCDQWKYMADPEVADELCNYRGCQAESVNHPEALFHMNTGSRLGSDPADRGMDDLWARFHESESSWLRGYDRAGYAARWIGQLVEWFLASSLSRHASPANRFADSRFKVAVEQDP